MKKNTHTQKNNFFPTFFFPPTHKKGRRAPILVTKEMIAKMKPGSVTVDLAAENGGNIETTIADQSITTTNGVTCLGYTDLVSRLSSTSSSLYANNISKLLLSCGPFTSKVCLFVFFG